MRATSLRQSIFFVFVFVDIAVEITIDTYGLCTGTELTTRAAFHQFDKNKSNQKLPPVQSRSTE